MSLILEEYSFVIPHDMETLIEFIGGPATFESRLDLMVSEIINVHIRPFSKIPSSSNRT